jgi:molybdopterin synthase catalytic subunit
VSVSVQQDNFDQGDEYRLLAQNNQVDGAIVTFVGQVREHNQGNGVRGLFLEHYPQMTLRSLESIVDKAKARWMLGKVRVIHRFGQLNLGDQIVFVGVTSQHRQSAFEAAEFIMDYLKTQAPFWKKETTDSGERWVEANQHDTDRAKKWSP